MIRLLVVVEGRSEQEFVKAVLAPHLAGQNVFAEARLVATKFERATGTWHKGGGSSWARWFNDLTKLLASDRASDRRVTTMFDLYRFPKDGPGMDSHRAIADTALRIDRMEASLREAVDDPRFEPYIQRHEFEALVLAAIDHLDEVLGSQSARAVRQLRDDLAGRAPEDVDEGYDTTPARRLERHLDRYDKVLHGVEVLERAGLPTLRAACPRFHAWVTKLEQLA